MSIIDPITTITTSISGVTYGTSICATIKPTGHYPICKDSNELQPEINDFDGAKPELSEEEIKQFDSLLLKIKDLPVFCFSVSDLEFILEKPLIINGKKTNDCYFYTYKRFNRLKKLIPTSQNEF